VIVCFFQEFLRLRVVLDEESHIPSFFLRAALETVLPSFSFT
jgi:hypothetical protein